jgi:hypothetical protein
MMSPVRSSAKAKGLQSEESSGVEKCRGKPQQRETKPEQSIPTLPWLTAASSGQML